MSDKLATVAAAVPAPVPEATIDALVRDLRALHRGASLEHALNLARMVVDRLYGGDLAAWRERGPKDGSFRRLAAKLDERGVPGLSAANLARAVAVLEVDERVGVSGRPQLTIAHVHGVAGLPAADQERLLGEAEARDLTAAELRDLAHDVRRGRGVPGRTGRPRMPAIVKIANRWQRELADEASFDVDIDVAALDAEEARHVRGVATAMRARCDALLSRFDAS